MFIWATVSLIIITHVLSCISPGPDFAVVTHNTLHFSRKVGLFTVLGISSGVLMHSTYCAFGLAAILMKSPVIFLIIRYLGGCYLIYLGVRAVLAKKNIFQDEALSQPKKLTPRQAFWQGFSVNATNPKCIFFIFSLFIMVAKLRSVLWDIFFVVEFALVTTIWFGLVVYLFSHSKVKPWLVRFRRSIAKGLGTFLIVFGLQLILTGAK